MLFLMGTFKTVLQVNSLSIGESLSQVSSMAKYKTYDYKKAVLVRNFRCIFDTDAPFAGQIFVIESYFSLLIMYPSV